MAAAIVLAAVSLLGYASGQTVDNQQDGFCEDPGVPENGFRVGNDLSRGGSGVLYICNNGFSLSGIERSTCRLDGTWSSPVSTCVGGAVIQPSVSPPCRVQTYGSPTSGSMRRIGDYIIYDCDFNHRLLGTRNISCFESSPLLPRCVWLQSDPCAYNNGGCSQRCLNEGGLQLCQCDLPQVISPVDGTTCETCPCSCPQMSADIILVLDEGSVEFPSRKWLYDLTGHMEQELIQAGFGAGQECSNLYGLVTYGGGSRAQPSPPRAVMSLEGTAMSNWTNFLNVLGNVETQPVAEGHADGYMAMKYALDKLPLRKGCPSVSRLMVLLTTRSREVVDPATERSLLQQRLQAEQVILHSIADTQFRASRESALGVYRGSPSALVGYVRSQSSFYRLVNSSVSIGLTAGTIEEDYVNLALSARGGAFNIGFSKLKSIGLGLAAAVVDNTLATMKQSSPCDIRDACSSSPCLNRGMCISELTGFTCQCLPAYIGDTCAQDICVTSPCLNGGVCQVVADNYVCTCDGGYTGRNCDTRADDPCQQLTCQNGGTCMEQSGTARCLCPLDMTGPTCLQTTSCFSSPCKFGGTCRVRVDGSFSCTCPPGFAGLRCEPDYCYNVPCGNGATCAVVNESPRCICPSGFTGDLCNKLDVCSLEPCNGNGNCSTPEDGSFECSCFAGYTGLTCSTREAASPCASNPCLNGGTCRRTSQGYVCDCRAGYKGNTCQPDLCYSVPCQNGGSCIVVGQSPRCVCRPGYSGVFCQQDYPCQPDPCNRHGQCFVRPAGGFLCSCFQGFGGQTCNTPSTVTQPCSPSPCQNGGTCTPSGSSYRCSCSPSFFGDQCQSFTSCERAGGCVDVAFVVDESASAQGNRVWLPQLLASLERGFLGSRLGTGAACRNRYGLVGFGRRVPREGAHVITSANGQSMVSAAEAGLLTQQLTSDAEGRLEDGYQALDVALQNLNFRTGAGVEKFVVLVTDEDRDVIGPGRSLTRQSMIRKLQAGGFSLYVIVDNRMQTLPTGGVSALGLSWPGPWYTLGNCEVTQGGGVGLVASGFSATTRDYATLALEVGGGAFDIRQLRSSQPNQACAFTKSLEKAIVNDACRVQQLPVTVQVEQSVDQSASSGRCVDTAFVVDVSRNMGTEMSWLPMLVTQTERELTDGGYGRSGAAICRNRYAIVIFARAEPNEAALLIRNQRGEHLVTADDFSTIASRILEDVSGRIEDGYQALDFAMRSINFRQKTSPDMFRASIVLISDEDRDTIESGSGLTLESVLQDLRRQRMSLHVIVDQEFVCQGTGAAGVDGNGLRAMLAPASAQDRTCAAFAAPCAVTFGPGFSGTNAHYTSLAIQSGGSAWDDNMLKNNPSGRCAFASSLAKSMVDAIRVQNPADEELSVCVDTIIAVDVSRNTRVEHDWFRGAMYGLDSGLRDNGFGRSQSCPNRYGVVVFGQSGPNVNGLILFSDQGQAMVPIDQFSPLSFKVQQDSEGSIEDGYEAIHLALGQMPLRKDSRVFQQVLLISDEDRDVSTRGEGVDAGVMASLLRNVGIHAVVDNSFTAGGSPALGITNLGQLHAFLPVGEGWFETSTSDVTVARGYARTNQDYVQPTLALNGSVWDVKMVRLLANNESAIHALSYNMVRRLQQIMSERDINQPQEVLPPPEECWIGDRCDGCDRRFVGNVMGQQVCCSNCAHGYANITEDQGCKCVPEDIGCADVLFVMDESKNTGQEHLWLPRFVQYLESGLTAQGIGNTERQLQCPNLYSLVGYGRRDVQAHLFRDARGLTAVSARDFVALASTLASDEMGFVEDGYHALDFGMERSLWRVQRSPTGPRVARAIVLVSDEDWDQTALSETLSREVMMEILQKSGASIHVAVDQQFLAANRQLLGMSSGNQGYIQLAGNQYQQLGGAEVGRGFARTALHYTELALALEGTAWNVILLRDQQTQAALTAAMGDALAGRISKDLATLRRQDPQVTLRPPTSVGNGQCWIGTQCNLCDVKYTRNFLGYSSQRLCCAFCAKGNASLVPVARNQFGRYTCTCQVDQGTEKD